MRKRTLAFVVAWKGIISWLDGIHIRNIDIAQSILNRFFKSHIPVFPRICIVIDPLPRNWTPTHFLKINAIKLVFSLVFLITHFIITWQLLALNNFNLYSTPYATYIFPIYIKYKIQSNWFARLNLKSNQKGIKFSIKFLYIVPIILQSILNLSIRIERILNICLLNIIQKKYNNTKK